MKYYRYTSSISIQENKNLQKYYLDLKDQAETVKTHFFEGRYENIYINKEKIPHLSLILNEALIFATTILKCQSPLKAGFWFNEMHFGDQTVSHTHDEDDEMLSGVYYITVPDNSGDLVMGDVGLGDIINIKPKAREFIFFAPDLIHGVKRSHSQKMRLSIGMNFGPA